VGYGESNGRKEKPSHVTRKKGTMRADSWREETTPIPRTLQAEKHNGGGRGEFMVQMHSTVRHKDRCQQSGAERRGETRIPWVCFGVWGGGLV